MKKLMTLMLGMSLAMGSVALFGQVPAETATKAPKKAKKATTEKKEATKAPKKAKKDTSK